MTLYAAVIVDVPTMQTDQPYTYLIPEKWQEVIEVGMRVEVPFGEGNRHLQGFVVGLTADLPAEITTGPTKSHCECARRFACFK